MTTRFKQSKLSLHLATHISLLPSSERKLMLRRRDTRVGPAVPCPRVELGASIASCLTSLD